MHSAWVRSTFLRFFKIPQIKDRGPNFLGKTISAERLNYLVPLLYLNSKTFKDPNSWKFIRSQCILHDSRVIFSEFSNLRKLKRGDLFNWQEPILQNGWIFWSPFCISFLESGKDPNPSSFIRFPCILRDSEVLFLGF